MDGEGYRKTLEKSIVRIEQFRPQFLVIALGLDPAKGDPTGTWSLKIKDFEANGRMVGKIGLPTVVIQEGGYRTQTLGKNARAFFNGLVAGNMQWIEKSREPKDRIHGIKFRYEPEAADTERVRRLVEITGFFHADEVLIAAELVEERVSRGTGSGYEFIFADHYGRMAGYVCFGPIPCTASSFDLYWIAVHPDFQGRGLGHHLLKEAEKRIRKAGGTRIYVDTSQRDQYAATRSFYENCGYRLETVLSDFYSPGDGKAVYCKVFIQ
jgi:ribosomal protein S18 acetylase RimI-like enzyme